MANDSSGAAPCPGPQDSRPSNPDCEADSAAEPGSSESPLLDAVLGDATSAAQDGAERLGELLRSGDSAAAAWRRWVASLRGRSKSDVLNRIIRSIADVDELIHQQLNAVLHHAEFQRLEASWRGLRYLVDQSRTDEDSQVRIRVLNVSWREIERDFDRASDFDQSVLFQKIYSEEFGMPGGIPFGLMLTDFEIQPRPSTEHPHDDVAVLRSLSQVAAAAFCPTIVAAHPTLLGLDSFGELELPQNHAATFQQVDYLKWRTLRDSQDARFLGVVMPRVLMREPYGDDAAGRHGFPFREDVSAPNRQGFLWGSAVYAFGAVVMRAFANFGWLADIRGARRGVDGGGLVCGVPVHYFGTDRQGVAARFSAEIAITDDLERTLSDLGFLPLCACKDSEDLAFHGSASLQRPRKYDRAGATTNARISSLLMHMLCVARFGHYVKVIGRDKVGTFLEPDELQRFLANWLAKFVTPDADAPDDTKARFPLRDAAVQVRLRPDKPGAFDCVMHLSPHYQLDELAASVRLETELSGPRSG